jgi:hypothetical protein
MQILAVDDFIALMRMKLKFDMPSSSSATIQKDYDKSSVDNF